jgi:hypothetical protein
MSPRAEDLEVVSAMVPEEGLAEEAPGRVPGADEQDANA